jgi:HEPN domain-containing protein
MAENYVRRATRYLDEAKRALKDMDFPTTVRRSQEALELAVKAVLRYLAVEYPREHDVGEALPFVADKLPEYLREKIPQLRRLLTKLAEDRGPAFYGNEIRGIPPNQLFGEEYARRVYSEVEEMLKLCTKFLEKILW